MYFLAVVGVIIAVDLVLAGVWIYGFGDVYVPKGRSPGPIALWARCRQKSSCWGRWVPRW
jgi:hypothetical protein